MLRLFVMLLTLLMPISAEAARVPVASAPAASPPTFAVIPFYSPEKIWSLYGPFIKYLRQTTGDPWQLQLFNNHREFIEGICSGRITVGLLGPVPLKKVDERCGAKPFLVALGKDGTPFYHSVIVTNDPGVGTLAGFKGKRLGFFKGSTAAHVVPLKMLENERVMPSDFTAVYFGSQDEIIHQLLSGGIDGAGLKEFLARRFLKDGLRIVAVSENLPNFALSAAPSAPGPVIQRLKSALLKLRPAKNSNDAKLMSSWDDEIRQGFITPGKDYLSALHNFKASGDDK